MQSIISSSVNYHPLIYPLHHLRTSQCHYTATSPKSLYKPGTNALNPSNERHVLLLLGYTDVHPGGFTQPGLSKVMQPEISKWFKATNGHKKMNKKYIIKETFWKNVYFGRYQNEQNATGLCIPGCVSEDKILSKIMQSNLSTVMQPNLSSVTQPTLSTVMQPG